MTATQFPELLTQEVAHETGGLEEGTSYDSSALYGSEIPPSCDVCGVAIHDSDEQGTAVIGRGCLVFYRGDKRVEEALPLCPSCGAVLGLGALARWAMEEEEG